MVSMSRVEPCRQAFRYAAPLYDLIYQATGKDYPDDYPRLPRPRPVLATTCCTATVP
jgi:hypothetical protein